MGVESAPACFCGGVSVDNGADGYPACFKVCINENLCAFLFHYTNKPFVQFYTTKRVGGGVDNPEACVLLKVAA